MFECRCEISKLAAAVMIAVANGLNKIVYLFFCPRWFAEWIIVLERDLYGGLFGKTEAPHHCASRGKCGVAALLLDSDLSDLAPDFMFAFDPSDGELDVLRHVGIDDPYIGILVLLRGLASFF